MRTATLAAGLLLSWLTGCRAFDPNLLAPTPGTLVARLPTAAQEAHASWASPYPTSPWEAGRDRDLNHLFEREVRETLAEPFGEPRCFLLLTTNTLDERSGSGWFMASTMTLGLFNLLGLPYSRNRMLVETRLDVLDQDQNLVGSYRAQADAKALGSIFSPTNYAQSDRVVYLQAVRGGLSQIKAQLAADAPRLQPLLAGGR
ncbi:hypothetical protein [Hymenobacter psychrophilus]|uniref:Lipoprotein n=1 Tax=Hymenobacter psychrophilus TaxID=651662 RepID=A0A1H3FV41_9BACT|nr:hypothetical protein [Hymenobacter psychrophilus]SDX94800.1 hypothetical protein SAMN04488069_104236 [Hymenobacter psychrophilus]